MTENQVTQPQEDGAASPFPNVIGALRLTPQHYPQGWQGPLPILLEDLDSLLTFSLLRYPFIRMYNSRGPAPVASYTEARRAGSTMQGGFVNRTGVMRMLTAGFSFELGAMHEWHEGVAELAGLLSSQLGVDVDAQMFVTPPGAQALALHRDLADGLVLHLAGCKRWHAYARPKEGWSRGVAEETGAPVVDVVLQPGDVLYFPGGAAHEAVPVGDSLAVHLTFGIRHADETDLAAAILVSAPDAKAASRAPATDGELEVFLRQETAGLRDRIAGLRGGGAATIASRFRQSGAGGQGLRSFSSQAVPEKTR